MCNRQLFFSLILLFVIALHCDARQTGKAQLPATQAGQRVEAYIKAFNLANEDSMRSFFSANVAEETLKRRSIDERIQIYKQMIANMRSLELNRVLEASPSGITCVFRTGNGEWFEFGFQFEPDPPHKLVGLRVEDTDPPNGNDTSLPAVVGAKPKLTEAEVIAAVENRLKELVAADQFSGAVLLGKNGKVVFEKAYGLSSKEYDAANRVDTKFNLGSINKLFTQVAIGQLVEQRKLSFDDKLSKHLSDYSNRNVADRVTMRQLLTMTSGVGDIFGERYDQLAKDKLRNLRDFIPLFADEPLAFEPGAKEQYSNGGYVLLGAIIEKLSGQTYYDYVREHIFRVAGMENTDSYEADAVVQNLASGYTLEGSTNGRRRNNIYTRPARGSSAGGGYSTVGDLFKFAIAVANNKIRIPNFRSSGVGAGATTSSEQGIAIAGGAPGMNSLLDIDPRNGYVVVVMSNYDPPAAVSVGKQIRQLISRTR